VISASDVRAELGNIKESKLSLLIDSAISDWEVDTQGLWNARTGHVQVFDLTMNNQVNDIRPELAPLSSISLVEYSADGIDYTTLASTGYFQLNDRTIRRKGEVWNQNYVRVTYDGGWTTATCPANVKMALLAQIGLISKRLDSSEVHVSSQNFEGGAGVFLRGDRHPLFKRIAGSYMRIDP